MAIDKKTEARDRINGLLTNHANQDFFKKHFIELNNTVQRYCTLKHAFKDTSRSLEDYEGFEKEFSQFYGIKRYVTGDFIENYYVIMAELRDRTEYDVKMLTERLKDGDKLQFSFVTKMLNIMDDAKYPIYDSHVARAFALNPYSFKNENRIDNYIACYQIIMDVYNELLPKHKQVIADFRNIIKVDEKEVPDMRVLDIIVWKLGGEIPTSNPRSKKHGRRESGLFRLRQAESTRKPNS